MSFLLSLFQLARPLNGLITWASVAVGAMAATPSSGVVPAIFWAGLSAALIASGGNAINDFFDVEMDRINKPQRPIPSGRISRRGACSWAMSLFIVGVLVAALLSRAMLCMALVALGFLIAYSWRLKRTPYWGNAAVSLTSALAFVYGGLAVSNPVPALVPATLAFLYHFGREIIKDIEDMVGDSAASAQTAPVRYGKRKALIVATVTLCLLLCATLWPFCFRLYGSIYLVIVLLAVDPVLVYVILAMWRNTAPRNLARLSLILKADMPVGLLAVLLGKL